MLVVVYLSLRCRKLLLSSACSSSKLRLDQLPRLSSPTLSCWDTVDSVASRPGELHREGTDVYTLQIHDGAVK